jgi:hypothetical protein
LLYSNNTLFAVPENLRNNGIEKYFFVCKDKMLSVVDVTENKDCNIAELRALKIFMEQTL